MISVTDRALKGYIFDIQGLSVHDGPGCRTLIFMKGCTLNCSWCSNPEGIHLNPDVLYTVSKCILCGNCIENCPQQAIQIREGMHFIDHELCKICLSHSCVDDCHTGALRICGYEISVDQIMDIIRRDRQFWGPDGGVTLSGGEPLLQIDFAAKILERCFDAYIHTAIETCGNVSWEHFERVLPWCDWIFFDLKNTNTDLHLAATGKPNTLIINNIKRLSQFFTGKLILRLPLITGFNDSDENIDAVISLMKETGITEINVLPLHHLGREKYVLLGRKYAGKDFVVPTQERLKEVRERFFKEGITCYLGSETGF